MPHRLTISVLALVATTQAASNDATVSLTEICPNVREVMSTVSYPIEALRRAIGSGDVAIGFTVAEDGSIRDVVAVEASNPIFEKAAAQIVRELRCNSDGKAKQFRLPFSYRFDLSSSYVATREDIPTSRLREVVPRIAELRSPSTHFTLKLGDGIRVDAVPVLAYDANGTYLGRLRQFDRDAQPKSNLMMRGAGIVQATAPGTGTLELSAPMWQELGDGRARPSVRIQIVVTE